MKKRLFAALIAGLFALLLPPAFASADTLTLVTVDCGDGYPLQATVDTNGLTELQASIQGMIDNPSGLSCSLSTSPVVSPLALGTSTLAGNNSPFVVGGGRFPVDATNLPGCDANFGVSAHQDSSGFHGTLTLTIPGDPACNGVSNSHLKAAVGCLAAATNMAEVRGTVSEATGVFGGNGFWLADVTDNPQGGPADQLTETGAGDSTSCSAASGVISIDNGNLSVNNGG